MKKGDKDISDIFGKVKNKHYRFRRDLAFVILAFLVVSIWYLSRYLGILSFRSIIPLEYFEFINLLSFFGVIIAFFSFYFFDRIFKCHFKKRHYVYIAFMAITAFMMSFFYFSILYFDKLQHFFFPLMTASIVYHLVSRLNIPRKHAIIFTFFIVLGITTIFELIEYSLDFIFDWKLQGVFLWDPVIEGKLMVILEAIDDTMIDLFLGILGTWTYLIGILFFKEKS